MFLREIRVAYREESQLQQTGAMSQLVYTFHKRNCTHLAYCWSDGGHKIVHSPFYSVTVIFFATFSACLCGDCQAKFIMFLLSSALCLYRLCLVAPQGLKVEIKLELEQKKGDQAIIHKPFSKSRSCKQGPTDVASSMPIACLVAEIIRRWFFSSADHCDLAAKSRLSKRVLT